MELAIPSSSLVWRTLWVALGALVLRFIYNLYVVRSQFRALVKEHGIPILPHSFVLGHIIPITKLMMKQPINTSPHYVPLLLAREYPDLVKDGVLYMDTWPIGEPMLVVFQPDMMAQFIQDVSLPKYSKLMGREFGPFTASKDLVNSEGQEWKKWRAIFNPGFSAKNLLTFAPQMVEETLIFRDWLKALAKTGEVKSLEDQATKVTIDVIGRAVLGTQLHCQTRPNRFYDTIQRQEMQISWLVTDRSPPALAREWNPWRAVETRLNNRYMRKFLLPFIDKSLRMAKYGDHKTVVDLAANAYLKEEGTSDISKIDPEFADKVIENLKIFIFAGHDTTASTLSFVYHLVRTTPGCVQELCDEHDSVLGKDIAQAPQMIKDSPQLLNSLPFTLACVKETLRLFPPAGTVRTGQPNFYLTNPESGTRYPTDGFMIFGCGQSIHREAKYWPNPDAFIPERFLAREGEPLHVQKNTYRPFELGPRGCIGQYLSLLEIVCILALTMRELDVISVYDEKGPKLFGNVAFPVMATGQITSHPNHGVPVRVEIRTAGS